jgi:hypothetical protein
MCLKYTNDYSDKYIEAYHEGLNAKSDDNPYSMTTGQAEQHGAWLAGYEARSDK